MDLPKILINGCSVFLVRANSETRGNFLGANCEHELKQKSEPEIVCNNFNRERFIILRRTCCSKQISLFGSLVVPLYAQIIIYYLK